MSEAPDYEISIRGAPGVRNCANFRNVLGQFARHVDKLRAGLHQDAGLQQAFDRLGERGLLLRIFKTGETRARLHAVWRARQLVNDAGDVSWSRTRPGRSRSVLLR